METYSFLKKWRFGLFTFAISMLTGCSTDFFQLAPAPGPQGRNGQPQYAGDYLELANKANPCEATEYRLRAAERLIQAQEITRAQQALRDAQGYDPNIDSELRQIILEARHALLKQDLSRAKILVSSAVQRAAEQTQATNLQGMGNAKRIALLLPSKGPHASAAKTIREGFFAAYYKNNTKDSSVKVFDTGEGSQIQEAYQQAIADQSDFIIGPLTKPEVQAIVKMRPEIPVLALNTLTESTSLPKNMFQFGLIPEDEVTAVAELARRNGHHSTLILTPQTDWGKRMAIAFKQNFEAKGGRVIEIMPIEPGQDLSSKIKTLLQVKADDYRRDADMLFLISSPDMARQIKSLLNYYADTLPVYATSTVYSGTPSPVKDQDLNGVHFCDMPWVLQEANSSEKNSSSIAKLVGSSRSPRFFALGMDAFELTKQMGQHHTLSHIAGMTGELSYNKEQHRITRSLVCARFAGGVPVAE